MKKIMLRICQDIKNMRMAVTALALYAIFSHLIFRAFCPMVIMTGFPCPGCGMTRALFYLITGRFAESVRMHPAGIWVVILFLYFCWNRYIMGRKAKGMQLLIAATCVMLVVCYIWRMALYFPGRTPYVYRERNILAKILPFYEQMLHELKIM
ncbi:MAG: DUF2752 domain-containing protein [Bacillus sp. (in: Bacteria)]|nr:DUF2752 domain-containing protein [Bacillus sp. (in: firmicutes)]MCM1425184.1 DUF2752 domain-containing protein [Eubacterium sp.]